MKNLILIFFSLISLQFFSQENKKYQVGDFAQGGIIFWLDETGLHGLVCAKSDQAVKTQWDLEIDFKDVTYGGSYPYPPERNTKSVAITDGVYSGAQNTKDIIKFVGKSDKPYAALICDEYELLVDTTMYNDWYLPSREELNLIYLNRTTIDETALKHGGDLLKGKSFWSSTDVDCNVKPNSLYEKVHAAYGQNFSLGSKKYQVPSRKYMPYTVRAIRAF